MRYCVMMLFILFLPIKNLIGQDMHFTQFYSSASSLYLNPAFTGAQVCSRIATTYRNQWMGVTKAYASYLASYDHYITSKNIGLGVLLGADAAGSGSLGTTIINPLFAYELKITKRLVARFGLQAGIGVKSINFSKLVFGDQIYRSKGTANTINTIEDPTIGRVYFDSGTGALIYTRRYWFGFSAFHLNKPIESVIKNSESTIPLKISMHGGWNFHLNEDEPDIAKQRTFSIVSNFRAQSKFSQLDMGCYFMQHVLNLGLWYRGIPLVKAYKPGYGNSDAIGIVAGLKADRFNMGYSYDFTISKLGYKSLGAHEVTLSYQMCELKKKKKKQITVPCPKF